MLQEGMNLTVSHTVGCMIRSFQRGSLSVNEMTIEVSTDLFLIN